MDLKFDPFFFSRRTFTSGDAAVAADAVFVFSFKTQHFDVTVNSYHHSSESNVFAFWHESDSMYANKVRKQNQ